MRIADLAGLLPGRTPCKSELLDLFSQMSSVGEDLVSTPEIFNFDSKRPSTI